MTVPAVGALAPISSMAPTAATAPTAPTDLGASATGGTTFAEALGHGLDAVDSASQNVDSLAVQAATGQLVDPAQFTIAASQASLMTQLAVTIQSKAVQAFNTIMGMQA